MHPTLHHIVAQLRIEEMRQEAERGRRAARAEAAQASSASSRSRWRTWGGRQRHRPMRFLTSKSDFSSRELAYLTDVDHCRHEALVAIDEQDGSMVAVARYVWIDDRPRTAEVAAEVADDLHGRGIGTALAKLIVTRARDNGFELLRATTLADNNRARALRQRSGSSRRADRDVSSSSPWPCTATCRGTPARRAPDDDLRRPASD